MNRFEEMVKAYKDFGREYPRTAGVVFVYVLLCGLFVGAMWIDIMYNGKSIMTYVPCMAIFIGVTSAVGVVFRLLDEPELLKEFERLAKEKRNKK